MKHEFKVIPKEEQTKCYCGHTSYCDCRPEKPKQETLEEAAKRIYPKNIVSDGYDTNFLGRVGLYLGAKWQQERSYNEEEVTWALLLCSNKKFKNSLEVKEWFEQFKKL
jgi:hypothetical protein